jgi:hypothetical protein
MNSLQIYTALRRFVEPKLCNFVGVFPRDKLPNMLKISKFPCCFVLNTDTSKLKGSHWVAVYYPKRNICEFFDSYGMLPSAYSIDINPSDYNQKRLQSYKSTVCGQYCIYFLYHRSLTHSLHSTLKSFTSNCGSNDILVACFVKKHFKISNPVLKHSFDCPHSQSCHSCNL